VLVRLRQEVQEVPRAVAPPAEPLADDAIYLEPLGLTHAAVMEELAADADVRRFTYVPSDAPAGYGEKWARVYEDAWRDGSRAGFAVRDARDGTVLGFVAFVRLDADAREGEAGYVVAPAARGRGVAARSLRLLTDWGFRELALERIELRIDTENELSERVAERCGYVRDGVLRSVHFKEGMRANVGVWSRLRSDG
jgi:RimJ/RimL family protein N-acetyltransferase